MDADIFAVREPEDMFAYAEPIAPKPTTASRIKPPAAGAAMGPILPKLGKPAVLPSPIPPDTKVTLPSPHPEVPAKPTVPKELRSGNLATIDKRLPRPKKPRYKLQVPMEDAFAAAHREITDELNSVSHPEDKERYAEALNDLRDAFRSGNERLMIRFLEDHVGWKTFGNLVQSLHDREQTTTSRPGLFGRRGQPTQFNADPEAAIKTGAEPPPIASADKPTAKGPPKIKTVSSGYRPPVDHPVPDPVSDSWWHGVPHTNWLKNGEEVGRRPTKRRGINSAWHIDIAGDHPGQTYSGIWKAADDDQTYLARHDLIPDGNPHGHEASAYEIAHHLGLGDMVPPTVSRTNRGQIGSVQHFMPGQQSAIESDNPFNAEQLPRAAAYDALTMNTDRHLKNWLVDPESGKMTLIDHGLSFPRTHKDIVGTSEILGKAMSSGIPVPKEAVQWQEQWPHIERSMKRNGLTDEQIGLTQKRLMSLADAAQRGESFATWLSRSGIGSNYLLR